MTYQWSILEKPQASTMMLNDPTAASLTITPDSAGTYVIQLVVSDGIATSTPQVVSVRVGTPVSGMINTTTHWEKENTPYVLMDRVMVPSGVTLSVAAGVEVLGQQQQIQIEGTFAVNGTPSEQVLLKNLIITPVGPYDSNHAVRIRWAHMTGGSLYDFFSGSSGSGSVHLSDSRFTELSSDINLPDLKGQNVIERNIFERSGGIHYSLWDLFGNAGVSLAIRNNTFVEWQGTAISNWWVMGGAPADISFNSFLSTDRIAVSISSQKESLIKAANNYWGTTDIATIEKMIHDKNDDLSLGSVITYQPILTAPHPDSPAL